MQRLIQGVNNVPGHYTYAAVKQSHRIRQQIWTVSGSLSYR
jgi:hypothetical protein